MRALFVLGVLGLAACSGGPETPALPPLPLEAGSWRRAALEYPPLPEAPELARTLGAREWARTRYTRDGEQILVSAFAFAAEASAFEAQQKWTHQRGGMSFHRGRRFVVFSAPTISMTELLAFSGDLEKAWLPPSQP